MLKRQEDSPKDPEEEMWQMSSKFHKFSCPFDPQKYEDIFTQAYSVWLSMEKYPNETKIPQPEVLQLRNKTKFDFYYFEPTPQKEITLEEYQEIVQNAAKDQELLKKSRDLARQLCKDFKQNDVFFTKQQIENILQDTNAFLKEKNTNMKGIRKVLKFAVRTLFIYQAYFNEYFQKPGANTELKIKYEKELDYLRREYKEQMDNINKVHPGNIGTFYLRLLTDLSEYPITAQKFFEEKDKTIQENIKNAQKPSQRQEVMIGLQGKQREKADQRREIKIEYQDENPFYPRRYDQSRLEESLKELSLQQDGLRRRSQEQDQGDNEKLSSLYFDQNKEQQ